MRSKRYQPKFVHPTWIITSLWYGLAFIANKKWKNKIYKAGKVDDRTLVLQLTRSRGKKHGESDI